ncbi:MAG TPA: Ppx/GppA phosphatase family protein [Polyangiaceae bacterium]|nr:Ppx/GppA phosphatase family protein [Polyangiaceae bacterium]
MEPETVAGVDLGSNSFHMIVARVAEGELRVIDRLRERVRLASGLDAAHRLSDEAMERGIACITRFGQRVRELPLGAVRAAGTNTLRQAKNAALFLERAAAALGHPIDVIAGREEARLIYLGVAHGVPNDAGRRLVIDIGGGSTECILGEGFEPVATESMFMGCVSYSTRFFPDGALSRDAFRRAQTAAALELQSIERTYRRLGFGPCYGSSGTVLAIAELVEKSGFSTGGITRKAMKKLRAALCEAGQVRNLGLPGLDPERAQVLPGGLAILLAATKSLGVERVNPAQSALREGLLYDLVGRIRHEDVRERSIRWLADRSHVDLEQAARVERTALACLDEVASAWKLTHEDDRHYLAWASRLHEIGLEISHTGFHRHGAYVVGNADMPGFSKNEQQLLAFIVQAQRRKVPLDALGALPEAQRERALRLGILFRLACCLNHSRSTEPPPVFRLTADGKKLSLRLAEDGFEGAPLTRADLDEEAERLAAAGVELVVRAGG